MSSAHHKNTLFTEKNMIISILNKQEIQHLCVGKISVNLSKKNKQKNKKKKNKPITTDDHVLSFYICHNSAIRQ